MTTPTKIRFFLYILILIMIGVYIILDNEILTTNSFHKTDNPEQLLLPNVSLGGDYTLTDPDGNKVNSQAFNGKYQLIYFGYTYCPDICPTELYTISQAVDILEKKSIPIQPVFITIDPQRDTKELLKRYTEMFHPRLIALTGTEEEITAVAKKFKVYFKKEYDPSSSGYVVDHTTFIYAFDQNGSLITVFRRGLHEDDIAKAIIDYNNNPPKKIE